MVIPSHICRPDRQNGGWLSEKYAMDVYYYKFGASCLLKNLGSTFLSPWILTLHHLSSELFLHWIYRAQVKTLIIFICRFKNRFFPSTKNGEKQWFKLSKDGQWEPKTPNSMKDQINLKSKPYFLYHYSNNQVKKNLKRKQNPNLQNFLGSSIYIDQYFAWENNNLCCSVLGIFFLAELRILVWIHQLLCLACITQLHLYDPSLFIWACIHL